MRTRNGTDGCSAVRIVTDHVSVAGMIEDFKSKSEVNSASWVQLRSCLIEK
jgi:hypothetical protein